MSLHESVYSNRNSAAAAALAVAAAVVAAAAAVDQGRTSALLLQHQQRMELLFDCSDVHSAMFLLYSIKVCRHFGAI